MAICWPIAQSRLLIDGKLVAGSAGTFPTVNPATEEVLGVAADAERRGHGPRDRGGPARLRRHRLVDATPSCGCGASASCSRRCANTSRSCGSSPSPRSGAPRMLTSVAQLEGPVDDLSFCADTAESLPVDHRSRGSPRRWASRPTAPSRARRSASSAPSPRGTSRTRSTSPRSDRRWRPATPSCSSPRPTPRGARRCSAQLIAEHTDIPAGCRQHRHVQRPRRRVRCCRRTHGWTWFRSPGRRATGRAVMADGVGDAEEGVPRTRRQVGVPGARRRGSRGCLLDVGVHRLHARRSGLRDHHPTGGAAGPLRRGRRGGGGDDGRAQAGRPDRRREPSAGR